MNHLYKELELLPGDIVQVILDKQANVRLLDSSNYENYKRGLRHRYYGGLAKQSPVNIPAPSAGKWYLVIDLGGYSGQVRASVSVING